MKKLYIEALRGLAIFFVIFNHTSTSGFQYYQTIIQEGFTLKYITYSMISALCKAAVPIFFMISGALILKKEESYKELFKKRIFRILNVLLFASLFYYILYTLGWIDGLSVEKERILDFLFVLYSGTLISPFWYLYAYFGFLLCLPFLRKMVNSLDELDFKYLLVLCLVFEVIKYVILGVFGINLNSSIEIFVLSTSVYYPMMGYFIEHIMKFNDLNFKIIIFLIFIMLLGTLSASWFNYLYIINTGNSDSQNYLNFFSVLNAPIIFILFKYLFLKLNIQNLKICNKIVYLLGSSTFGIYLLDELLRQKLYWYIYTYCDLFFPSMISCFIGVLACLFIGCIIITLLKKTKIGGYYL